MKNNILTLIIAVLLAGAAYYFFVLKKTSTPTDKGNTDAPPLTKEEVGALTDSQIMLLTLSQLNAITFEQTKLLTPAQISLIASQKATLQDAENAITALKQQAASITNTVIANANKDKLNEYMSSNYSIYLTELQKTAIKNKQDKLDAVAAITTAVITGATKDKLNEYLNSDYAIYLSKTQIDAINYQLKYIAAKDKMSFYTVGEIDKLKYEDLIKFSDLELKALAEINSKAYDEEVIMQKKGLRYKQLQDGLKNLSSAEMQALDNHAASIVYELPTFFAWEDRVKNINLYEAIMGWNDTYLFYFCEKAWPKYNPDYGFIYCLKLHNLGVYYDNYYKNHGWTADMVNNLKQQIIDKCNSLYTLAV